MKYVLDTDLLSLLERGGAASLTLQMRLETLKADEIFTTVITYEEQMRGWLARVAQANTPEKMQRSYARLLRHIEIYKDVAVLPFGDRAITVYETLRHTKNRLGTMDLRIAATVLANNALLLTRNLRDFSQIPNLRAEDWAS